ncbi:MAG TPA: DUF1302 domain-containing protein [Candidatus Binatia bacterium]|nr:DUF1302 domain-containing protein [Candidatus Binatia bacterium]
MRGLLGGRGARGAALAALVAASAPVQAVQFKLPFPLFGSPVDGTVDTFFTFGAGMRMQGRNPELIGKADNNPDVCAFPHQGCQGVFKDEIHPANALVRQPGQFSMNSDDGNLNYDKHDLFQAPAKVTSKLSLHWGDWGVNVRALYFYDFINNDFTEFHPNWITAANANRVGRVVPPVESTGFVDVVHQGQRVYGPGGVVQRQRTDGEVLREAGTDLQWLDAFAFGTVPIGEHEITVKLGRQIVNWGESTALVINSVNQANPVNANNLFRVGFQLDELFVPVNMLFLAGQPFENATLEGFYQLEWRGLEAPAPGTFFSTVDVGTDNAIDWVNLSFGQAADDPDGVGVPLDNPLSGITKTSARIQRLKDYEPSSQGQFGLALKYFADWLNNGTEIGLYYMNYHSRLPYVSFYAAQASCARREGNPMGIDANSSSSFSMACPDLPFTHPDDPRSATSDAVPLDTGFMQLEYPENIQLLGASFNTSLGDYTLQGEVAFRPNLPLQVAIMDVAFAGGGPLLTRCHDASLDCTGSNGGLGTDENGFYTQYGPGDFTPAPGVTGYNDTFDLAVGNIDGSARSFPNFILPYRGRTVGENPPTDLSRPLDHRNPGYLQGYERFAVWQFNLGTTRIFSATENPFAADQIILLGEAGADWIPDLPPLDRLQIQGPATFLHASAGADGSGADGSHLACSTNPSCSVGPDGARFNPHQQDASGYTTRFAWGYRVIGIVRYEAVFPGISIQPFFLLGHDVKGIAPGPGENFIEGRKSASVQIETRYHDAISLSVGYNWFWGAGTNNLLSDRDNAQIFAKYQF